VPNRSRKPKSKVAGEHIFPASQLTPLGAKWKELTQAKRHREAMDVLEEIIKGSTPMFERLAMHEGFQSTVDLSILVSAAQEKVVKWLMAWEPKKGRLFTYFSKCAKNAFLSEVGKMSQYRKRFYTTSDTLEEIRGHEDHEVDKHDLASDVFHQIRELHCRWGCPQEVGCLRFMVLCITSDDTPDKNSAIWSAAYAWGVSHELARFFYTWALIALRNQLMSRIHLPFTDQDLIRAMHSYTLLPDVIDTVGIDAAKRMIATFGGQRIKIPTLAQLAKDHQDYMLAIEIQNSDQDPDSVAAIARRYGKTEKSAMEVYQDMVENLDSKRYGEHPVFPDSDHD